MLEQLRYFALQELDPRVNINDDGIQLVLDRGNVDRPLEQRVPVIARLLAHLKQGIPGH